jgi:hypothetical protein
MLIACQLRLSTSTSSMARRSTAAFLANARSFFMRDLQPRFGLSHLMPAFSEPQTQLTKQSLALTNLQV